MTSSFNQPYLPFFLVTFICFLLKKKSSFHQFIHSFFPSSIFELIFPVIPCDSQENKQNPLQDQQMNKKIYRKTMLKLTQMFHFSVNESFKRKMDAVFLHVGVGLWFCAHAWFNNEFKTKWTLSIWQKIFKWHVEVV